MAVFKVETKNKVEIDKKPRVYFTCHPEDFEKHFKKICEDIFKTHDCAIYYTEDMAEVIAEDEKQVDLGRNNLFVVPVTFKLLTTPNRAMDEDIPYAMQEHIPVLPIMMEPGIDEFYSNPDKFGELQYLNPYSTDLTEISYEEKLKKYLESVLISDELAKRVRAAFDAYIFLSYRKKDRKYANELMRLIHSNPECRDIAIWFDEFLTPGESFKENIEKILDDCKLFTLLVTPQLLEKVVNENGEEQDNYVISTELPLARKKRQEKGTEIFAVEMENTNEEALLAINIDDYVNPSDETFRARLLETISRIVITTNNTPEHTFLVGLAYLDGIDVEVDRERGVKLIQFAAEAGLYEAMQRLYNMFLKGIDTAVDYKKAALWAERIYDTMYKEFGQENPNTLAALSNLGLCYSNVGDYVRAMEITEKAHTLMRKILGKAHPDTLSVLNNLAYIYIYLGEYSKALEINREAYSLRREVLGDYHPDTLISLNNLAGCYGNTGDYTTAIKLKEKELDICVKILGERHPDTLISLSSLSVSYSDIKEFSKALELEEKAYMLRCEVLGEEHPNTLTSLNNIAVYYSEIGNYIKSMAIKKKVYSLRCKVLGEEHPETLTSLDNLATGYCNIDDYAKSKEMYEKAYSLRCKVLGSEHPETLISLGNFAVLHFKIGNHSKALKMMEEVYALRCKILGETHPHTLMALKTLSIAYARTGNQKKAFELQIKMLKYKP